MSATIHISLVDHASGALAGMLRSLRPDQVAMALAVALDRASQVVVGSAQRGRFSGKGPYPVSDNKLGVVTGNLRRSIRCTRPQMSESGELSVGFGSQVKYFAVHEFGFSGTVQVRGHQRKIIKMSFTPRGKLTKAVISARIAQIASRHFAGISSARGNSAFVRPHSRRMRVPARAPLGTELRSPRTVETYRQSLDQVIPEIFRQATSNP